MPFKETTETSSLRKRIHKAGIRLSPGETAPVRILHTGCGRGRLVLPAVAARARVQALAHGGAFSRTLVHALLANWRRRILADALDQRRRTSADSAIGDALSPWQHSRAGWHGVCEHHRRKCVDPPGRFLLPGQRLSPGLLAPVGIFRMRPGPFFLRRSARVTLSNHEALRPRLTRRPLSRIKPTGYITGWFNTPCRPIP